MALVSWCLFGYFAMINVFAEEEYYNFGSATERADRLEAENHNTSNKATNSYSPYASGEVLEMAKSSEITLTVNAEQAGEYVLKYAYFTADSTARMTVEVNGGSAKDMGAMSCNGWASQGNKTGNVEGKRMLFFHNFNVDLAEGTNTVVIQNSVKYTNVDFIEFYKADDVYYYPIERQLLGMQYTGERIEAEWGCPTDPTKYTEAIKYDGNSSISGCQISLDSDTRQAAEMNYTVYAEKAGEYYLQISNAGNQETGCEQTWKINGEEMTFAFDFDNTSLGNVYQTEHVFPVTLQEGKNTISFTKKTGSISTDWFKLIEKTDNLNTIIQAEDYTLGAVKSAFKVDEAMEIIG